MLYPALRYFGDHVMTTQTNQRRLLTLLALGLAAAACTSKPQPKVKPLQPDQTTTGDAASKYEQPAPDSTYKPGASQPTPNTLADEQDPAVRSDVPAPSAPASTAPAPAAAAPATTVGNQSNVVTPAVIVAPPAAAPATPPAPADALAAWDAKSWLGNALFQVVGVD